MAQKFPLSKTKIIIPGSRPEILHRARLLPLIDNLLDQKLVLIIAPAGYGKTTFLVDFARQAQMPVCWLSLDALDTDPQRFISYLIAAITERFPDFGRRSTHTLRSVTLIDQDIENLVSVIVNEILEQINEHFIFVIDDYHEVDSVPVIRDFFNRFISLLSENCHVILSSRRLPTIPDIAHLVASRQVSGFDLQELAFTPEEIRDLYARFFDFHLTEGDIKALSIQTEGWITGILLSAPRLIPTSTQSFSKINGDVPPPGTRSTVIDLTKYLQDQVLERQTPELRRFLLLTSIFEEFDVELCEKVLGKGNWQDLFNKIKRDNLFLLPVGADGKWLRYHPLVGNFLRERAHQELHELLEGILIRLEKVYEERGEWEKAYSMVQKYGTQENLADLVERAGTYILLDEHFITLQTWLDAFPISLLNERPVLLSLKGALMCSLGKGSAALPYLDQSIELLERNGKSAMLALTLVRRAAARRTVGNYEAALQDADRVLEFSHRDPSMQIEIAEAFRFRGLSLYRLGQIEKAGGSLEESLMRYEKIGEAESIARLQMELGIVRRGSGRMSEAVQLYQKALSEWERENNLVSETNTLNNLAVLFSMQGQYEKALKNLERGLGNVRKSGPQWQEAMLFTTMGDILTDIDEFEPAHELLTRASTLAHQVSYQFLINYLLISQARLARVQSRFQEARNFLENARPLVEACHSKYELGLLLLESGSLALVKGEFQTALGELHEAHEVLRKSNLLIESQWVNVWLAAAYAAKGDKAKSLVFIRKVSEILLPTTEDIPLVHRLRQVTPWLKNLLPNKEVEILFNRASLAEKHLRPLRRRLKTVINSISLQPSRLSIRALGKPQVLINGETITLSKWHSQTVRDLFFYFLQMQHPMSREEIGEVFWPESEPEQLKLRFKNNLYRLRHALGIDTIQLDDQHYFFNNQVDYEYDVDEFKMHLARVAEVKDDQEKIRHLSSAVALWKDTYLKGIDATWVWSERSHLEKLCEEAFRQLIDFHRKLGNQATALQVCRRALQVNACLEDIHRIAMRLHAEMGNRVDVIWQYQTCRDALKNEMDISPSEETENLYKQLTK
jgi:LuxR family transcriptional regulator, maltose regulon positive regulatory protein